MKKLIVCLLVFMIGITACEGPMGPAGPPGRDAVETGWFIDNFEVFPEHWKPATEKGDRYFFHYWEYEFALPQLTDYVLEKGFTGCFLVQDIRYDGGRTSTVHRPLPYTIYGTGEYDYSENYSFELRRGFVKFIVKYSDFDAPELPLPLYCIFRVVLIW